MSVLTGPARAHRRGADRLTDLAVIAVTVGLLVGAATSVLQGLLVDPFAGLANAVGPRLLAPFLLGSVGLATGRRSCWAC